MLKKLLTIILTAIILTGCVDETIYKNEIIQDNKEIKFYISECDNFPNSFKVLCVDTLNNYFNKFTIFKDNYKWIPNNSLYWSGNSFNFYACTEDNLFQSFEYFNNNIYLQNYEVNLNSLNQSDLMYSVVKNINNGYVYFKFSHALSQIDFAFQNNHPLYDEIEILSIELGGIKGKGTYVFPNVSTNNITKYNNSIKGTWIIDFNSEDCTYIIDNINMKIFDKEKLIKIPSYKLYMIPQFKSKGAYIKVRLKVSSNNQIIEELIPIYINWKENEKYTYYIILNPVPITFSVTIDEFVKNDN